MVAVLDGPLDRDTTLRVPSVDRRRVAADHAGDRRPLTTERLEALQAAGRDGPDPPRKLFSTAARTVSV